MIELKPCPKCGYENVMVVLKPNAYNREYIECPVCGTVFTDEEASNLKEVIASWNKWCDTQE